jgi:hypothetical protein
MKGTDGRCSEGATEAWGEAQVAGPVPVTIQTSRMVFRAIGDFTSLSYGFASTEAMQAVEGAGAGVAKLPVVLMAADVSIDQVQKLIRAPGKTAVWRAVDSAGAAAGATSELDLDLEGVHPVAASSIARRQSANGTTSLMNGRRLIRPEVTSAMASPKTFP